MERRPCLLKKAALMFIFSVYLLVSTALASLSSMSQDSRTLNVSRGNSRKFIIENNMFWKDKEPFRIIGGDLHYFRVHPEYWEDRLLRAKALGLNTIQTYVPWNLHEPRQGDWVFKGFADIIHFLKLCQKLDLLVMLRPGPYICGEWDFGGFPAWLLSKDPPIRLRSSDPAFLALVKEWWDILLPKIQPFLYSSGGPIIMVQIENEFGSFGDDKGYLHYLAMLARRHLGNDVILYTTDGGTRQTLEKGTIPGDDVFSAVDFTTGDDPWPIFQLQKEFNAPGKSPPLSSEFYTGWLTHWGEKIASTDANFTASYLEKILANNGSAVLYMAHGGTNFGMFSGANTGDNESDYKPDLTSYDYDAPIRESGDVHNEKYKAIRKIISKYSGESLVPIPHDNEKISYGKIKLEKRSFLFDLISNSEGQVFHSENPVPMELMGQMFGFVLYSSKYSQTSNGSTLYVPKVHDRAQVFVSCPEYRERRPIYVATITRWSNVPIDLPYFECQSVHKILILVENMGRLNYGRYIFDRKGILSPVFLDGRPLHNWEMHPISFQNINEAPKFNSFIRLKGQTIFSQDIKLEPAFYSGIFHVEEPRDTYLSFKGWSKGIAFVNNITLGRFWPSAGPQCNLYVPAPFLQQGDNTLVILELEYPNSNLTVSSLDHHGFTCGPTSLKPTESVRRLRTS